MLILDLSEHNGTVDFSVLKENCGGVMLRLSLGYNGDEVYRLDRQASRNIAECHRLGIPFGVYHYSYADTVEGARSEALGVIKILRQYQSQGIRPSLPIVIDLEDNNSIQGGDHQGASWEDLGLMGVTFCEELERAGFYAMIYASRYWFEQMGAVVDLSRFDQWLAEWGTDKPSRPCGIWQFSNRGLGSRYGVPSKAVDVNECFYDYITLIQDKGLNGFTRAFNRAIQSTDGGNITITIKNHQYTFTADGELLERG